MAGLVEAGSGGRGSAAGDARLITIQSAMLIALGVFLAGFAVFLMAPFYRRRAARLATDALRRSMPLTEAEIRADKDRLRAEHAIAIHKLESKAEESALSAARQMVEINRRDAAISTLESKTGAMRTAIEEHENARRVLEQTITDRLPRVESRLALAKKQLFQRDQEITSLSQSSSKYSQALEEATQINAQHRDEIHRLNATITTRAARNREPMGADARFDSEVALRSEIEALRAKARDQSALLSRLQSGMVHAGAAPSLGAQFLGTGGDQEVARLRDSLSEAELALRAARSTAQAGQAGTSGAEADLRALKSINQDQQAEIARLKAALRAYEADDAEGRAMLDSKIALKARLSSLQAQSDQHNATIHSLRAEIAAANEKLARQASQYMDEMRRLGAGTMPASGPGRRESYEAPASSLAARISAPRPIAPAPAAPALVATASPPTQSVNEMPDLRGAPAAKPPLAGAPVSTERPVSESERVSSNFLRALTGATPAADATSDADQSAALENAADAALAEADRPPVVRRRPGLLERLTNADKPAASGG